ncbi:MAG: hypothetical protein IPF75_14765 [Bacteroidetes bacterium]|nr:hypothetical protein [Bacteroidota bacterium]
MRSFLHDPAYIENLKDKICSEIFQMVSTGAFCFIDHQCNFKMGIFSPINRI